MLPASSVKTQESDSEFQEVPSTPTTAVINSETNVFGTRRASPDMIELAPAAYHIDRVPILFPYLLFISGLILGCRLLRLQG